jgi:hypothetical protein
MFLFDKPLIMKNTNNMENCATPLSLYKHFGTFPIIIINQEHLLVVTDEIELFPQLG